MPSTDGGLIPDFDDLDPPSANVAAPAQDTEPEEWPPTIPTKKNKKSKKSKKHATAQIKSQGDDDDSPYAKSITPSPPNQQGVNLPASLPGSPPQPAAYPSPLQQVELPLENDDTAVEEQEPLPKSLPAPTPLSKSPQLPPVVPPRPRPAKLVSPAASPPVRPAVLNDTTHQTGLRRPSRTSLLTAQPRRDAVGPQPVTSKSNFVDPPPPHMPQSHFFSLPDLGLDLPAEQEAGKLAGTNGYCCSFDSFSNSGDTASAKKAKDALLVGFDGGLDVYRVLPDKLEVVGRLEGLRGAVIKAKLLPQTSRFDTLQKLRPLVVAEVHGPVADDRIDSGRDDENAREPPVRYQTTVEVYSLQNQTAICTLYRSLPVDLAKSAAGQPPLLPAPVGDLSIATQGSFITIASGKSGEVFVFSNAPRLNSQGVSFRCIGKYWTSVQTRQDPPKPLSSNTNNILPTERRPREPLYSLSQRWLAIVPPYVSPGTSIQGWPLLASDSNVPPGLSTHAPPNQPTITCEIGGVDAEGTLGWLSRKAAQSLVKASQRGYDIGLQGWKELTQPSPASGHNRSSSREQEAFPPTNAPHEDPQRLAKEPALVSIIDLQRLLDAEETGSRVPQTLATFALVDGCNYLSFSPEGLRLLITDRKGEVSNVWDLKNVAYSSTRMSNDDEDSENRPHVRQLNRFARSSPSVVLDSIWSIDGHWLALLTAHGTIHLHQISDSAPMKRRRRRNTTSTSSADKADPIVGMTQGLSPPSSNGIWQSVRTGWQSVSTQVGTIRSQGTGIPTTFAGFREVTAAAGSAGTRAVARGLSQGFSAAKGGASDIWHADDNKIRHKSLAEASAGSVSIRWIQKRSETLLGVVYGGNVHLHPVQQVTRRKGDDDVVGLKKYPARTFTLPRISTTHDNKPSVCTQQGPHGFWILQNALHADDRFAHRRPSKLATTQMADVETNPPYCPFHVDSRVSIYAFDEHPSQVYSGSATPWHLRGHGQESSEPWVFGGPLPPSSRMNESAIVEEDRHFMINDADTMQNIADQMRSQLIVRPNDEGIEQINVNTRRTAGLDEERFGDVAFDDVSYRK